MDHSLDLHFESKILFWLIFCILDHVLHIFADSDQNPGSTNVSDPDPDPGSRTISFYVKYLIFGEVFGKFWMFLFWFLKIDEFIFGNIGILIFWSERMILHLYHIFMNLLFFITSESGCVHFLITLYIPFYLYSFSLYPPSLYPLSLYIPILFFSFFSLYPLSLYILSLFIPRLFMYSLFLSPLSLYTLSLFIHFLFISPFSLYPVSRYIPFSLYLLFIFILFLFISN